MPKSKTAREIALIKMPGRHSVGGGLVFTVKESGSRYWTFRYQINKKSHEVGLGPYPGVSLADARAKAQELKKQRAGGEDPLGARRSAEAEKRAAQAARAGRTFQAVAEAMMDAHEVEWKNAKHRQQWRNTLAQYVYPMIGEKPVAEIGTDDVLAALRPIWTLKPETASRVRQRIERVISYAMALGYRERGLNPAGWRGHLDQILAAPSKLAVTAGYGNHAALPWAQMPDFWRALATRGGMDALALRFLILTAARTSEVLGALWGEIDAEAGVWTVPADRMKAGKEHRVALSPPAIEILEQLKPLAAGLRSPVFPGRRDGKPLSGMALLMLLRRMNPNRAPDGQSPDFAWKDARTGDAITAHGFRSTFRDWCFEETSFPREIVETSLAHTVENATEAAYRRGDAIERRRELVGAWAGHVTGSAAGNVVRLRRA